MDDKQRYNRQMILPEWGEKGQEKLKKAKVLVVGVGGLGSPIALYLVGAGVGTIGLMDADVVSESNLQRQVLYQEGEIGTCKVECAQKRLEALNSNVKIVTYPFLFSQENAYEIARNYDIIVDGCDNFETRYLMDQVSHSLNIPYVFGSIGEYTGMVSIFNHNGAGRYSDLFPKTTDKSPSPSTTLPKGVVGPVPGVIGSIEAMEVIKLITGCGETLTNKLFTIDLRSMQSQIISL